MTPLQTMFAFAFAAGILTVTPGLDTALVLRTAAVEGPRRAWLAGIGIGLGCLVWGLLAAIGIGAVLKASTTAYHALRIVGAAYLLVLGIRLLWDSRRGGSAPHAPSATDAAELAAAPAQGMSGSWFVRGFLTNLLNPKVGVFYATFLPQFIPQGVDATSFGVLLAMIHVAEGMLWFALLIGLTRPFARWLGRPAVRRGFDRATGAVLVLCGVRLALARDH